MYYFRYHILCLVVVPYFMKQIFGEMLGVDGTCVPVPEVNIVGSIMDSESTNPFPDQDFYCVCIRTKMNKILQNVKFLFFSLL